MVHPEARQPERDLVTDLGGRSFSRVGNFRATMGREVEAKEHENEVFARQICHRLDEARTHGELESLVLLAPPAFLGLIRKNLDQQVLARVGLSIDKDLTQLRADELRQRLPRRLCAG